MWFLRLEPQSLTVRFSLHFGAPVPVFPLLHRPQGPLRSCHCPAVPLGKHLPVLPLLLRQVSWICHEIQEMFFISRLTQGESLVSEEQITISHPEFFSASRIWSPKSEQDDSSPSSIKTRLIFFILFLRIHGM